MSVYKEISVNFKTAQSLMKALQELGFTPEHSFDFRVNSVNLVNGWHGEDTRQVAIMVGKNAIKDSLGVHVFGGFGFTWNPQTKGYEMVVDNLDSATPKVKELIGLLKQRYSYHEVKRLAVGKGYTVRENKDADGTIRISLVHG